MNSVFITPQLLLLIWVIGKDNYMKASYQLSILRFCRFNGFRPYFTHSNLWRWNLYTCGYSNTDLIRHDYHWSHRYHDLYHWGYHSLHRGVGHRPHGQGHEGTVLYIRQWSMFCVSCTYFLKRNCFCLSSNTSVFVPFIVLMLPISNQSKSTTANIR